MKEKADGRSQVICSRRFADPGLDGLLLVTGIDDCTVLGFEKDHHPPTEH